MKQCEKMQQDGDIYTRSAEKRYAYTLRQIAGTDRAWCLINARGDTVTLDFPGCSFVCIWPDQNAARRFALMQGEEGDKPYEITGQELKKQLTGGEEGVRYAVYPTEADLWTAAPEELLRDLSAL